MAEFDSHSEALKQANKATKEARAERDYYRGLSGMYQLTYDDDTQVHQAIIILQGIYVELQSDLLKYKQSKGIDERVEKSQARLSMLRNQLTILSEIQTTNMSLKQRVRDLENKNHLQWAEINDLNKRLQLHTDNLCNQETIK